jgi:hypothetical protein
MLLAPYCWRKSLAGGQASRQRFKPADAIQWHCMPSNLFIKNLLEDARWSSYTEAHL